MMSLTFGLFTQVSCSGPLGLLDIRKVSAASVSVNGKMQYTDVRSNFFFFFVHLTFPFIFADFDNI